VLYIANQVFSDTDWGCQPPAVQQSIKRVCPVKALRLSTARNQSQETRVPPCQLQAMPFPRGKASSRRVHEGNRSPPSSPPRARRQGGQRPALLLRSCFRYFSLSLQSAWHVSIALLVPYRSDRVYRCSLRDTPEGFRLQFQAALHRRRQQE
jgi:hypothetical protein